MDTLCVLWKEKKCRTSNVPKLWVSPRNPKETELKLDQEVKVLWLNKKPYLPATIYSMSPISDCLSTSNNSSKKKSNLTKGQSEQDVFDFVVDETVQHDENDSDYDHDGPETVTNAVASAGPHRSDLTDSLSECSGCAQLRPLLKTVIENQGKMAARFDTFEKELVNHTQNVRNSCNDSKETSETLCQHVTATTSMIKRIDDHTSRTHTLVALRMDTQINNTPGPDLDQPSTSTTVTLAPTPLPVLMTPVRAEPRIIHSILNPPNLNENGDAVINGPHGDYQIIPIKVFNTARRPSAGVPTGTLFLLSIEIMWP